MNPKSRFFELAKKLSKKSTHPTHQLGCVVSRRNQIMSIGYNKLCTHPQSPHAYKSLHAEISAIIGYSYSDLKNCLVYVYRETRDGKPAKAKPCPSCEEALKLAGVRGVFYTDLNHEGWTFERYK